MQISKNIAGSKATLGLEGRFDFHAHREFRSAYEEMLETQSVSEIEINFTAVDYLDSSALGMLLLLREKAESRTKSVVLCGLQGTAKQVLDIANFGKLFAIKD